MICGKSLGEFDLSVSSLMLLLFIAHKDQVVPPLPDGLIGVAISEFTLGNFKFLMMTYAMDCPAIEYAWHIDARSADPRKVKFEEQRMDAIEHIVELNWKEVMLVADFWTNYQCRKYYEIVIKFPHDAIAKRNASNGLASLWTVNELLVAHGFEPLELTEETPQLTFLEAPQKIKFGNCIMCGEYKRLTGEHIFADWIGESVDYSIQKTVSTLQLNGKYSAKILPGNHIERKLEVLCGECNNEWGSKLQGSASKALKPFIKNGEWKSLTLDERRNVGRWATCFVMVREFLHPELVSIAAATRLEFRSTNVIPKEISIWVSPFAGQVNKFKSRHTAFGLYFSSLDGLFDSHMTTFVVNSLVFFAFGSSRESLYHDDGMHNSALQSFLVSKGFVRVWPCKRNKRCKRDIPEFPETRPDSIDDEGIDELIPEALEALTKIATWMPLI